MSIICNEDDVFDRFAKNEENESAAHIGKEKTFLCLCVLFALVTKGNSGSGE